MKRDLNKMLKKVRDAQKMMKTRIDKSAVVKEMKNFARSKTGVLKKQLKNNGDVKRLLKYVETRNKELDRFIRALPNEVRTMKKQIKIRQKELEKVAQRLLQNIKDSQKSIRTKTKKKASKKKRTTKKTTKKKTTRRKKKR